MSAKASTGSGAPIGRPIARQTLRCALVLSGAGAAGGRPAQSGGAAVNSTRRTAALAVADSELTMPRARTPPVRLVPIPCAGVNAVPAGQPPRAALVVSLRPALGAGLGRTPPSGTPAMLSSDSDRTCNEVRV